MTENLHKSTQTLIANIERKDKRFRIFQSVSLAVIAILVVILLLFNYQVETQNNNLLQNGNKTIAVLQKSGQQRTMQLQELQQHIDCIVALFGQPDRANLTIANIKNCTFASTPGGSAGVTKSQ